MWLPAHSHSRRFDGECTYVPGELLQTEPCLDMEVLQSVGEFVAHHFSSCVAFSC